MKPFHEWPVWVGACLMGLMLVCLFGSIIVIARYTPCGEPSCF